MPFRCRKSIYFDKENIMDLIFHGYCITYEILESEIVILEINGRNLRKINKK